MTLYYAASAVAEAGFGRADARRKKLRLPGLNSLAMNRLIWTNWDWTAKGEEWTPSPEWKQSVIERLLRPNIPEGSTVLEIGPGGGRWTEELQRRSRLLVGLDISESCVQACQARFAHYSNVEFRVGSGANLEGVGDASIDAVWSFDVFVHINRPEFQTYTKEFARVLRPGGVGVIQHGSVGGSLGGWRSNVSSEDVRAMLLAANLVLVEQIISWRDNGCEHQAGLYDDAVTVFRKPAA
jgi:SAM-dependent methyltransferase